MMLFIISIILPLIFAVLTCIFLFFAFRNTKADDKSSKFNILAAIGSLVLTIYFGTNIKPPAPIIYPLDNEVKVYDGSVKITIDSNDSNPFISTYYSLNGSDPKKGHVYKGEFTIAESTTVSARNKFLWSWSEPTKSTYRFESMKITYNSDLESFISDKLISVDELVKGILLFICGIMCIKAVIDTIKESIRSRL